MLPYGIIRRFSFIQYISYVYLVNHVNRNDVAIEKAQVLVKEHGIKAFAYKVDGKRSLMPIKKVPKC